MLKYKRVLLNTRVDEKSLKSLTIYIIDSNSTWRSHILYRWCHWSNLPWSFCRNWLENSPVGRFPFNVLSKGPLKARQSLLQCLSNRWSSFSGYEILFLIRRATSKYKHAEYDTMCNLYAGSCSLILATSWNPQTTSTYIDRHDVKERDWHLTWL